jgi:hypothetical protein
MLSDRAPRIASVLKWVGGKRQLLPVLRRYAPSDPGRYFEPFVGSGAASISSAAAPVANVTPSDDDANLIGCYARVSDALGGDRRARAPGNGARRDRTALPRVRRRFNPLQAAWRETGADVTVSGRTRAMLIYLNRTGYNGLYRVNASGEQRAARPLRQTAVDRGLPESASARCRTADVLRYAPFDRSRPGARRRLAYFDRRTPLTNRELPRLHRPRFYRADQSGCSRC